MTFVNLAAQLHSNYWVTFSLRLDLDFVKEEEEETFLDFYLSHQTYTPVAFSSVPVFLFKILQFVKVGVLVLFSQVKILIMTVS